MRGYLRPPWTRPAFTLVPHQQCGGRCFGDRAAVDAIYRPEIVELISGLSGADYVAVQSPGILRFSEKSAQLGSPG